LSGRTRLRPSPDGFNAASPTAAELCSFNEMTIKITITRMHLRELTNRRRSWASNLSLPIKNAKIKFCALHRTGFFVGNRSSSTNSTLLWRAHSGF
jgi:hypothetical protein